MGSSSCHPFRRLGALTGGLRPPAAICTSFGRYSPLRVNLAQTKSVRVFSDVHDLPLRPPAVLAKAAATLDQLSGGRIELGIGAGGFLDAAHAMGAPALTPGASLAALEEVVPIMRAMWSPQRRGIRFDGRHYQLSGAFPGPAPAHPIKIWIGAKKPRALALTGRLADGWVSPLMNWTPPAMAAQDNVAIDRAAREVVGILTRSAGSTTSRVP
jgi:alkanesulfonate monooxygenase SsuD/methylene tetrahydromethanopterin reductase-like flavin-dependent oxidoreductase (luciferase family)